MQVVNGAVPAALTPRPTSPMKAVSRRAGIPVRLLTTAIAIARSDAVSCAPVQQELLGKAGTSVPSARVDLAVSAAKLVCALHCATILGYLEIERGVLLPCHTTTADLGFLSGY
jgi:hypothetical protein